MNDLTDQQLLRNYAERQSEIAFAELVRRHVDLVYSAALRMVCDAHHWIRDDAEHARLAAYVANNPVKARLCQAPEDWKWSSSHERRQAL